MVQTCLKCGVTRTRSDAALCRRCGLRIGEAPSVPVNVRLRRLAALALVVVALAACGGGAATSAPAAASAPAAMTTAGGEAAAGAPAALPAEVDVARAKELQAAGAFLLDVREPSEWVEGHIDGATLIPLGELPGRVAEVPAGQQVVVVCRSGNRSQAGRDILLEVGLPSVTSMAGGVKDWAAAGYPLVTGE